MAQPVLVRAYTGNKRSLRIPGAQYRMALPPISAYAFADILRTIDSPELQLAIDGIAEICAKNRMSLAEEYASHMPPVGEITGTPSVATTAAFRSHTARPGTGGRALTSVPEASSSGSEGSRRSKKHGFLGHGSNREPVKPSTRTMRIGSMGRSIFIVATTAVATAESNTVPTGISAVEEAPSGIFKTTAPRSASAAVLSLQQALGVAELPEPG